MCEKLKILFLPINLVGHVLSAIGQAQVLMDAGHDCWLGVSDQWSDILGQYGIKQCPLWSLPPVLNDSNHDNNYSMKTIYQDAIQKLQLGIIGSQLKPFDKLVNYFKNLNKKWPIAEPILEANVDLAIRLVRPDVIMCDQLKPIQSVISSGIPWVTVCSCNPLVVLSDQDHRLPPLCLGLPIDGQQQQEKWLELKIDLMKKITENIEPGNELVEYSEFIAKSDYLTIYDYPLELDYQDLRPLANNFYRFDNFMRKQYINSEPAFELPVQLMDKPGKFIYISMGSIGGIDIENMKRLIGILEKSRNKFIVSKGLLADDYDLPDNMWGQPTVPQTLVLGRVDLVITHGGNNTVTECFYFGKPMIVMPMFCDQYDNAQRIDDKGYGRRLDAYQCSESELLETIDSLLSDNNMIEKLAKISERIQSDNSLRKLPKLLENLVEKNRLK